MNCAFCELLHSPGCISPGSRPAPVRGASTGRSSHLKNGSEMGVRARSSTIINHMVEHIEALDRAFSALGDATRRAILRRLTEGSATVTELADPFEMSLNAVSKHIRVLERAGLLKREVRGREHWCSLNPFPLKQVTDWAEPYRVFWEQRLDALEEFLRQDDGP